MQLTLTLQPLIMSYLSSPKKLADEADKVKTVEVNNEIRKIQYL